MAAPFAAGFGADVSDGEGGQGDNGEGGECLSHGRILKRISALWVRLAVSSSYDPGMGQVFDFGVDGTLPRKLLWVLIAGWVVWSAPSPVAVVLWALFAWQTWRTWVQYKELRDYKKLSKTIDKAVKKARS